MHETRERDERRQKLIREHRRTEAKLVEQGQKAPYYLKQSTTGAPALSPPPSALTLRRPHL